MSGLKSLQVSRWLDASQLPHIPRESFKNSPTVYILTIGGTVIFSESFNFMGVGSEISKKILSADSVADLDNKNIESDQSHNFIAFVV